MRKQDVRRTKGSGSLFKRDGKYLYQWREPDGSKKTRMLKDELGNSITIYVQAVKAAEALVKEQAEIQQVSNKLEYLNEVAEAKNIIARTHISIAEMWDAYVKSPARPDSSSSTLDFYHDAVQPFQKWMQDHHAEITDIHEITTDAAEEYAADFWKSGVSERTYNARIMSLKMILKVLLRDTTPFDAVRRKTPRQQSRNAFTPFQLKAISDKMDDPGYYMLYKPEMKLMLLIMLYTGCRGEDAALMKWRYIDWNTRTITYVPLKTGRKRPVPVSIPMAECLYAALENWHQEKSEYILPHVSDRYKHNPCGISLDITKLLEAAGIQTKIIDASLQRKRPVVLYSMHSFRHTFCTLAINAGIPLSTIQEIVGHSTAAMTSHYSHISLESKQKAVIALEGAAALADGSSKKAILERLLTLTRKQLALAGHWLDTHLTEQQKAEFMTEIGS